MTVIQGRVLVGLVTAAAALVLLPTVARADGCGERIAGFTGGRLASIEDGDCNKAEIAATAGSTLLTAIAATLIGVTGGLTLAGQASGMPAGVMTAVQSLLGSGPTVQSGAAQPGAPGTGPGPSGTQPGPGGGNPPPGEAPTDIVSGAQAIDVLIKAGKVTQVTKPGPDGKPVPLWETDPRDPDGPKIPVVRPVGEPSTWDPTGGTPVTRPVGWAAPTTTGTAAGTALPPDWEQHQTITGIQGYGGTTRPDGTLDPTSTVIVVGVDKPGEWVQVTPPAPAAAPPSAATPPAGPTSGAGPDEAGTPQSGQGGGGQDTPDQANPPTQPGKPSTVQPPLNQPGAAQSPTQPPATSSPQQSPPRTPSSPDDVKTSLLQPGTTLIDPRMAIVDPKTKQAGPCVDSDGKIVNIPGGIPPALAPLIKLLGPTLDTESDQLSVGLGPGGFAGLDFGTDGQGHIIATPNLSLLPKPLADAVTKLFAGVNDILKPINQQFADHHIAVDSVTIDPKTKFIKVVTHRI